MAFVLLDRSTSNDCEQGNIQALACGPESAHDRFACGDSDCGPSHGKPELILGLWLRGQDLHLRLEVMSLSYCPTLLPRHII